MNVNPLSEQFGDVVPWDSLTDEQKSSGDWIELPDVSGEGGRARKRSPMEKLFALPQKLDLSESKTINDLMRKAQGNFDATGKPR